MKSSDMWYGRGRDYREQIESANKSREHADMHHKAWLGLRKQMREYFYSMPNCHVPDEIKKAIGMKK